MAPDELFFNIYPKKNPPLLFEVRTIQKNKRYFLDQNNELKKTFLCWKHFFCLILSQIIFSKVERLSKTKWNFSGKQTNSVQNLCFLIWLLPPLSSLLLPPPRTQKKVLDRFRRFEFEGRAINLTMTVKVYLVSDNYQNK